MSNNPGQKPSSKPNTEKVAQIQEDFSVDQVVAEDRAKASKQDAAVVVKTVDEDAADGDTEGETTVETIKTKTLAFFKRNRSFFSGAGTALAVVGSAALAYALTNRTTPLIVEELPTIVVEEPVANES